MLKNNYFFRCEGDKVMNFLLLITPIALFIILFLYEKRTMWIGFLFISLIAYLLIFTTLFFQQIHIQIALTFATIFGILLVLLMPFYVVSFIIVLITSGVRLIKREGKQLRNFLSLLLGTFIIFWSIAINFITIPQEKVFLFSLSFFITLSISYFFLLMISFAVSSLLNRFKNPFKTYDYIIVLGSGLIGKRVPPLLASRIDKGIQLFDQYHNKDNPVKIIFTGGQGRDEEIAEGVAMANYAMEKGIDKSHIMIEDQATNTYENILFSKQLIDKDMKRRNKSVEPNIITVTNNFHMFRSLLWTRKVGVKSDGAGSQTKFYFWLNALIREFIGVLYMQRTFHIVAYFLIALLSVGMYFITKYGVLPFKFPDL